MKQRLTFRRLLLAAPLLGILGMLPAGPVQNAYAQDTGAQDTPAQDDSGGALHVVKSSTNADSDNAELCLEFDRPLAPLAPARLAAAIKLEADGTSVTPANIATTAASLCLYPLDRGKSYRLSVRGLRGAKDEKMASTYSQSFVIPDRSPSLAFTGRNGGISSFGGYHDMLILRAVNVAHARLTVYRLTDPAAMARAWQDRAQIALAPSESAYLARNKGQQIWEGNATFDTPAVAPNATVEQPLSLQDKIPELPPGLYLIVADAGGTTDAGNKDSGIEASGNGDSKTASKGLAPLAAAWFVKSDFVIRALRDGNDIHVFASLAAQPGVKGGVHLSGMSRKPEQLAEAQAGADGTGLIAAPPNGNSADIVSIQASDDAGNIAFADIASLPALSHLPALGTITQADLFAVPGDAVDLTFSLAPAENAPAFTAQSILRLGREEVAYADYSVPALAAEKAKLSFTAPASPGLWTMRWRKTDGSVLAEAPLRVTGNPDAPRLDMTSDHAVLGVDTPCDVTLKALTSSGHPVPLVGGNVTIAWQKRDPALDGWKDYQFGLPAAPLPAPTVIGDFLTDFEGSTLLHLSLPSRPQEPGLYQAVLTAKTERDAGVADATPLTLPLRPEATAIGIKPLAPESRFPQNAIARFSLIALGPDGKLRDDSGLSYQIYEAGRSFAWYPDEGRWNYKPEPQLRPIGGGGVAIKADGSATLEWPVTAGNYRLQILDANAKPLAEASFSAGSGAMSTPDGALSVSMAKTLQPGVPAIAHVDLAQPAMLTAIVADTHIRKIIHEVRPRGDNQIAFTPSSDWQAGVSLSVLAQPQDSHSPSAYGETEAAVTQPTHAPPSTPAPSPAHDAGTDDENLRVFAPENPAALDLRPGEEATLSFGIENLSRQQETYHYKFTSSPGLGIDNGGTGTVTLGPLQSRAITLGLSTSEPGVKDIHIDIAGTHTLRLTHSWQAAVLAKSNFMHSLDTIAAAPGQQVLPASTRRAQGEATVAFVSRRSMDGLGELLAYAYGLHPYTTEELALSIDVLRQWGNVIAASGIAPAEAVAARRQQGLIQLLERQNPDGGFAPRRGADSTMQDTAAALIALGPDTTPLTAPARDLAVNWTRQRLSNTWFDEKERALRAEAYAALAAADAVDPASLHYFSDTSANGDLPAIAEADIAAAFKHIHDPNAAAFWVKKMLDSNGTDKTIPLLNALAATDALSSDDVHQAMRETVDVLRAGDAPGIATVMELLRAITTDNADAGDWQVTQNNQRRSLSGVMAARLPDAAEASLHNSGAQPLMVTFAAEATRPPSQQPRGGNVSRHVYRLNGVELSPQGRPARAETYIVELKGVLPAMTADELTVVHEGAAAAIRPIGCPLSPRIDTPPFIPWFSPKDLTPTQDCEMTSHGFSARLAPGESASDEKVAPAEHPGERKDGAFNIVYFAHIDSNSIREMTPPRLRVVKEEK
jgi:uncharacterized protein YfaS (alpha-2-macroglobulin family)